MPPTNVSARHDRAGIWEAIQIHLIFIEPVRADNAHGRMVFSHFDHAGNALGKKPIVRMNDFAVFAFGRHSCKSRVVIDQGGQKGLVFQHRDTRIFAPKPFCDLQRTVCTTIVYDDVLPVLIGLVQDAFNAFCKILLRIINGCNNDSN